jgi:hypothetical protein
VDATIEGPPHAILGLLSGALDLEGAKERGVSYDGDPGILERVCPGRRADAVSSL